MSKMGQVNLDLQEQAEELGFETVQEALDNGYRAFINIDGTTKLINMKPDVEAIKKSTNIDAEMMAARQQYLLRKNEVIKNLEVLVEDTTSPVYKRILKDAINFINEKEV